MKSWGIPLAVIAVLSACGDEGRPAVLPDDFISAAKTAQVAPAYAGFAGVWSGTWGECLRAKLAVLSVTEGGTVRAYYAWGDCREQGYEQNGGLFTGLIDGKILRMDQPFGGAKLSFTLTEDGALTGNLVLKGKTTTGPFTRDDPGA